jgi:Flp pilus assembly protein TadG
MRDAQRLSNERGATMVEMLMVLPVLLIVIFGSVELSRAWYVLQATATAVREGARAASVATSASLTTVGNSRIDAVFTAANITPTSRNVTSNVLTQPSGCAAGTPNPCDSEVVATATVNFQTLFPVLIPRLQTVTMTQTARLRFEGG